MEEPHFRICPMPISGKWSWKPLAEGRRKAKTGLAGKLPSHE
jgi:hypothetical protein